MSDRPLEDYSLPYLWKRIAELEGLIADLQCSGGFCGLSNELCDNCRIRFKALGEAK